MSELSGLLDDIAEGKDISEVVEDKKEVTSEDEDLENTSSDLDKLTEESLEELNNAVNRILVKEAIKEVKKVGKDVVLEALVGLSEAKVKSISGRLTSYPSKINKAVIEDLEVPEDKQVIDETTLLVQRLAKRVYDDSGENILDSRLGKIQEKLEVIASSLEAVNCGIVIHAGKRYNTIECPIEVLAGLDYSEVEYERFNTIRLGEKYKNLSLKLEVNETLSKLVGEEPNVIGLYRAIKDNCVNMLNEICKEVWDSGLNCWSEDRYYMDPSQLVDVNNLITSVEAFYGISDVLLEGGLLDELNELLLVLVE